MNVFASNSLTEMHLKYIVSCRQNIWLEVDDAHQRRNASHRPRWDRALSSSNSQHDLCPAFSNNGMPVPPVACLASSAAFPVSSVPCVRSASHCSLIFSIEEFNELLWQAVRVEAVEVHSNGFNKACLDRQGMDIRDWRCTNTRSGLTSESLYRALRYRFSIAFQWKTLGRLFV